MLACLKSVLGLVTKRLYRGGPILAGAKVVPPIRNWSRTRQSRKIHMPNFRAGIYHLQGQCSSSTGSRVVGRQYPNIKGPKGVRMTEVLLQGCSNLGPRGQILPTVKIEWPIRPSVIFTTARDLTEVRVFHTCLGMPSLLLHHHFSMKC